MDHKLLPDARIETGLEIRTKREIDLSPLRPGEEVRESVAENVNAPGRGRRRRLGRRNRGGGAGAGGRRSLRYTNATPAESDAVGAQW